jgi:DNA-binding response OmpR family regulator
MEEKRFLIIERDRKERENIKRICEEIGYRAVCVDNLLDVMRYIPSFTGFACVIINVDLPNDDAMTLCGKIKTESPETLIVGLRLPEERINHNVDALLFKPLYKCVLEMVLDERKIG